MLPHLPPSCHAKLLRNAVRQLEEMNLVGTVGVADKGQLREVAERRGKSAKRWLREVAQQRSNSCLIAHLSIDPFVRSLVHWLIGLLIPCIILIRWFICQWFVDSLVHSFIDSLWFIGSLFQLFIDSLSNSFVASLVHWFIKLLIHCFSDSLLQRLIGSLLHSVSCAWNFSCHVIGISTTICSVANALHNCNISLLLHFKKNLLAIYFLSFIVVLSFRDFRPGTAGDFLAYLACYVFPSQGVFGEILSCRHPGIHRSRSHGPSDHDPVLRSAQREHVKDVKDVKDVNVMSRVVKDSPWFTAVLVVVTGCSC